MHSSLTLFLPIPNNKSSKAPTPIIKIQSETPSKHATIPSTISLLHTCQNLEQLKQIHAQFVVVGLIRRCPMAGKLVESYVSTSHIDHAWSVFDRIDGPDAFAYNTMIRGLTVGGQANDSLLLFNRMVLNGLMADNYTYTFMLKACSRLSALMEGKQVHCMIIKVGMRPDNYIHSSLIHMYGISDSLDCARKVFDGFSEENTLIKNAMITVYLQHGRVDDARDVFDGMMMKDDATWSAMVSGYTKNCMFMEALGVFWEMTACGAHPNESMVVSALTACAQLGALDQGRWIHLHVCRRIEAEMSVVLGTALVDMYAKCGSIDNSYEVFRSMTRRDVVTWTAMISGFAMHGYAEKSFELFDEMVVAGIQPNEAVFVAVLSACTHAGHVEMGGHYFDRMTLDFGITPSIEHYGCMVDLLSRAGHLAEAEDLIASMPMEPNPIIWGTLLGACRNHKDLARGKRAFNHLIALEPRSGDRFKLIGHVLAVAGKGEDAIKVRKLIKENEMGTTSGSSCIEVDGMVHEFVAGDIGHKDAREIYMMLDEMKRRIEEVGFVARREEVVLNIDEEEKEIALSRHSERLAIAYGLLRSGPKSLIRVYKNLRICTDCHRAIKFISKEFGREIIVRDRSRFHVFKGGECSCMDYW
ncbi:pentatricopeptide repeat-containing protein At5g66520-like [Magnolia sinica]|uniref:pentatricopeptide repeat-containing protein At5g66520-like n=1 Tax=Magnolia sinica TaxID=86752 RepID=UPI0026587EA2|nr:pentatricopeptide repeat-containing protein At5g66520-like [Magnolia sinica]